MSSRFGSTLRACVEETEQGKLPHTQNLYTKRTQSIHAQQEANKTSFLLRPNSEVEEFKRRQLLCRGTSTAPLPRINFRQGGKRAEQGRKEDPGQLAGKHRAFREYDMDKGNRGACPPFIHVVFGFICAVPTFFGIASCQDIFSPPLEDFFTPPSPDGFDTSFEKTSNTINASVIAGIIISIVVVAIAAFAVFYCLCILDKRTKNGGLALPSIHIGSPARSSASGILSLPVEVRDHLKTLQFTYAEVLEITSNLRIKLGEGGFGPVYYGKSKDGSLVAVKRLSSTSLQGTQEFLNEVEILSRAHHRNVVSLVGYCCEANERCLIYEYMPKGTLDDRLHGLPSEQEPLKWLTRLQIAVGAAKGFNYLHNDCAPAIIHRDVKCSNILLDEKLTAKVADFGLSKLLSQSALTHITTGVKGTFGYLDPEYAQTQRLTEKSDVYSFGVILLELLTGNKAIIQHDGEYVHIAQWARPHITTRAYSNIVDKKLGDIIDKETVQVVANIALQCVAYKSTDRPYFQEILQVLEAALKLELPEKAHSPAVVEVSIDIQTVAHTVVPIAGGPYNRNESISPPHKTV